MVNCANSNALMAFSITPKWPEDAEVRCQNLLKPAENSSSFASNGLQEFGDETLGVVHQDIEEVAENLKKEKGNCIAPLVETEARRIPRIQGRNDGFKHNSCAAKNCQACYKRLGSWRMKNYGVRREGSKQLENRV